MVLNKFQSYPEQPARPSHGRGAHRPSVGLHRLRVVNSGGIYVKMRAPETNGHACDLIDASMALPVPGGGECANALRVWCRLVRGACTHSAARKRSDDKTEVHAKVACSCEVEELFAPAVKLVLAPPGPLLLVRSRNDASSTR